MRNFQNAAKRAGGTVVSEYPGWCKTTVDESMHTGNNCILYGTTLKLGAKGKEIWAFVEGKGEGEGYEVWLLERETMKQDIEASQLREKLDQGGVISLYLNFDTGSAIIQQSSIPQLKPPT